MTARRFPLILTLVVAVALALLLNLGVWQVKRLAWKTDLLARMEAGRTAEPMALTDALAKGDQAGFVRVKIDCPGLLRAPYEQLYGMAQGRMVARLVSACPLPAGGPYDGVLIDRGYVPAPVAETPTAGPEPVMVVGMLASPVEEKEGGTTTITTQAMPEFAPGKRLWMGRQLDGMGKALGLAKPAPYFLMAENITNPAWPGLTPGAPPVIIPNNHLQYALTWFALAGVLGCIYAVMLWIRYKRP